MDVVNLEDKLSGFSEAWSPRIVGDLNDMHVKVVKLRGEFVWHHHDTEDELFLVVAGRLRMQLRSGDRDLGPGRTPSSFRTGTEHSPAGAERRSPRRPARARGHAEHGQRDQRAHGGLSPGGSDAGRIRGRSSIGQARLDSDPPPRRSNP